MFIVIIILCNYVHVRTCDICMLYKMNHQLYFNTLFLCTYFIMIFCRVSSDLFATSSRHDVRVWHSNTGKELLRISVPNLQCNALAITPDGNAIITGTVQCTVV